MQLPNCVLGYTAIQSSQILDLDNCTTSSSLTQANASELFSRMVIQFDHPFPDKLRIFYRYFFYFCFDRPTSSDVDKLTRTMTGQLRQVYQLLPVLYSNWGHCTKILVNEVLSVEKKKNNAICTRNGFAIEWILLFLMHF